MLLIVRLFFIAVQSFFVKFVKNVRFSLSFVKFLTSLFRWVSFCASLDEYDGSNSFLY